MRYLNTQLPKEHTIKYIAWDMARCAHSKEGNVLETLNDIAERTLQVIATTYLNRLCKSNLCRKLASFMPANKLTAACCVLASSP